MHPRMNIISGHYPSETGSCEPYVTVECPTGRELEKCENLKMWDALFGLDPTSRLHHDQRCPLHS